MVSPLMDSAPSNAPAEKFWVPRQPMLLATLTRNGVPRASSAPMAGWERTSSERAEHGGLQRLRVGDLQRPAPLSLMTIAFRFFEPMTAPKPPRDAVRGMEVRSGDHDRGRP